MRSLSAPSAGMHRNCSRPNTVAITPYHSACSSGAATKRPTISGNTGINRPMPSMSMKTQTRTKLSLPVVAGGASELGLVMKIPDDVNFLS